VALWEVCVLKASKPYTVIHMHVHVHVWIAYTTFALFVFLA